MKRFSARKIAGVVVVPGLMTASLACGPAAPRDANESAGIQSPPQEAPQPDPTVAPTTAEPTQPPPPTTDPDTEFWAVPTNTPWPTLIPEPPAVATEIAQHELRAAGQSEPSLAVQVQDFIRTNRGFIFDSIVRAEITEHRLVQPDLETDWPDRPGNPPFFHALGRTGELASWRRAKLKINETYLGALPQGYEILAPDFAPNQALEIGQEYILFIRQAFVAEGELPDKESVDRYNEAQLTAFGGRAGFQSLDHSWLIDGTTAWRLPRSHIMSLEATPGLTAGRNQGDSMTLSELIKAINAGLN